MTEQALDIYAYTNPAVCSLTEWSFVAGFCEVIAGGCEFPLIFLPVPLVLSEDTARSFVGTNIDTGMLGWVHKTPGVVVGLAEKINATASYSRRGLLFGLRYGTLEIAGDGRVTAAKSGLKGDPATSQRVHGEVKRSFAYARRLGHWIAAFGSTSEVLRALGLTL